MCVKLVIEKRIVTIVSAYAPLVGISDEEKGNFWNCFIIVLYGIPKQDISYLDGHVKYDLLPDSQENRSLRMEGC